MDFVLSKGIEMDPTNPILRNAVLVVVLIVAVFFGIEQIPGPTHHYPPLPPHVLVMADEKFLVAPGYGAYGKLICYTGHYQAVPGGKAFNGWWILTCPGYEGTHNFSYPKSKEWSYASSP